MSSWKLPDQIKTSAEEYFNPLIMTEAMKLVQLSRVSISFTKGSPETYYIVSGIVRDDRSHESKLVFKNRLKGTPEGPLSSNCDCHNWTEENHCPHVCCLFLNYHLQVLHESNPEALDGTTATSIKATSSIGVCAEEYGVIIGGPHQLIGSPPNPTYSSMQYTLANNKVINFPIPNKFSGKLFIKIDSAERFNPETGTVETMPMFRFKYEPEEGKMHTEISLFENLYLFDWSNGEAYHLPSELRDLVQKIRIYQKSLTVNDLIKLVSNEKLLELCDIVIDNIPLQEIQEVEIQSRVTLKRTEKKGQIEVKFEFFDPEENLVQPPDFLSAFTFEGGLLSSFKRKKDSYEFIKALSESIEVQDENYKKLLTSSNQKTKWLSILGFTLDQEKTKFYDHRTRKITLYDNKFLVSLIKLSYDSFGELFFRYSTFSSEDREINFLISNATLFNGLSDFYYKVGLFGVQIFYDKKEIGNWKSRIRFERRATTTKWFDLQLNVTQEDLEIIKQADLDTGLALTKDGLVLLSKEQKDLLKFMKKYTLHEGQLEAGVPEEGAPLGEEEVNKFILPFNRARIFELFELKKLGVEGALTTEEEALCEKLATLEEIPSYDVPAQLDEIIRPYQRTGYNWLRFLHESKLGACLADDMGLGKTLQTIAFINSVYDQIDRVLVVCPVTILLNWEKEIQKFSDMEVYIYHGGGREFPKDTKIVLTSYGVMKREAETTLGDLEFDVLILDEVQHLKNIRSMGAFAARKIKADFRICLTGTPVENDLAEFFNIIDLCVPGIWGDLQFIRTTSTSKSRLLARKTASPFILRRTKGQVLTELPPKIEVDEYLTLSDEEKNTYEATLVNIRHRIQTSPSKKKYGEILRGLLQLRQSCLWQQKGTTYAHINSTKISFLIDTLEQILEEGHQAIVFSQFTTYLDIIQHHVSERHWKHARIDGSQSAKKRQSQVDLFQEGKCPIFLISLKAGGVGLNLTAASFVFVMDPWWNPAVEAQAIDRAHRIGQKNTLTVYRPIIKGSVEEKVLELQKLKKELFYDLLPEDDDQQFSGKLTMKDFEHLLT
ncbi:MAG: hypothetical protein CME70_21245 [Halobacteriovorax sp.]|nr:hypothetical protein [Halobacteriovorax sp.]|tara:strand:+ start:103059 stop:106235 length:3177 start_codon:yes stop_codon:yes gene_type:complete